METCYVNCKKNTPNKILVSEERKLKDELFYQICDKKSWYIKNQKESRLLSKLEFRTPLIKILFIGENA